LTAAVSKRIGCTSKRCGVEADVSERRPCRSEWKRRGTHHPSCRRCQPGNYPFPRAPDSGMAVVPPPSARGLCFRACGVLRRSMRRRLCAFLE